MHFMIRNNENGMALVLAMFMLALLSMVGVASMMTSTTEIEIATGEKQSLETFYRSQSAQAIAGEAMLLSIFDRGLPSGSDTIGSDGKAKLYDPDDNDTFKVIDPDFLKEGFDSVVLSYSDSGEEFRIWRPDAQTLDKLPCPDNMTDEACMELNNKIGTEELDKWTDIRLVRTDGDVEITMADIDVDKVKARAMAGGGAEFGAKDLGSGAQVVLITYNIDSRGRLFSGSYKKSPSRQSLGFRILR